MSTKIIEEYPACGASSKKPCSTCLVPPLPAGSSNRCCAVCPELKGRNLKEKQCNRMIAWDRDHCDQHALQCKLMQQKAKEWEKRENNLFFPGLMDLALQIMRENKHNELYFHPVFVIYLQNHQKERREYLEWLAILIKIRLDIIRQCYVCHPDAAHLYHVSRLEILYSFVANPQQRSRKARRNKR